jgi:hypothetical protein
MSILVLYEKFRIALVNLGRLSMRIVLEKVSRSGPNGDRATHNTEYFDYNVHLCKDEEFPRRETIIRTFRGYDDWWTSVKDPVAVAKEAKDFAEDLAKRMEAKLLTTDNLDDTVREQALRKLNANERRVLGLL